MFHLYKRKCSKQNGIRVQLKPDVDFSFVPPQDETGFNWFWYCTLHWLEITPRSLVLAINNQPSLKGKLVEGLQHIYEMWLGQSDRESILGKEIAFHDQLKESKSAKLYLTIKESYVSPFAKYAHALGNYLEPFLKQYRGFNEFCSLDVQIAEYLSAYALKMAQRLPNYNTWNKHQRQLAGETLKVIALGEMTASATNCTLLFAGLDRVQVSKARNVIQSVLHACEHGFSWIAFKSQPVELPIRVNTGRLTSTPAIGSIRSIQDITETVLTGSFVPWRRFVSFLGREAVQSKKPISDRTIKRDIQFLRQVMRHHNYHNNVMNFKFDTSPDTRVTKRDRQVIKPEEVCKIWTAIRDWKQNKANRVSRIQQDFVEASILLMLSTGFRESELSSFQLGLENGIETIYLPAGASKTKSGERSQVVCPTIKHCVDVLLPVLAEATTTYTPFVWVQTFFKDKVKKALGRTPHLTPYDLRATALAYYSRFHPNDPNMTKAWAGHSQIAMSFDVYASVAVISRYPVEDIQLFFKFIREHYFDWKGEYDYQSILDYTESIEIKKAQETPKKQRFCNGL